MANVRDFTKKLIELEGIYDVPRTEDVGGETCYGVARRFSQKHTDFWEMVDDATNGIKGNQKKCADAIQKNQRIRNKAMDIFYEEYWFKISGDMISSQKIAEVIADFAFNCGVFNASIGVQKVINEAIKKDKIPHALIAEDGKIGGQTIQALNLFAVNKMMVDICKYRVDYYISKVVEKNEKKIFLKGWVNRVISFYPIECGLKEFKDYCNKKVDEILQVKKQKNNTYGKN